MKAQRNVWMLLAIIALLVLAIVAFPSLASAGSLNLAHAGLARAMSLPQDSPHRIAALDQAQAHLARARDVPSTNPRVALAQARIWLARAEPQRAAQALRAADAGLQNDFIAQFFWAQAEWQSSNVNAAYAHWRTAGALTYFTQALNRARDRHQWDAMYASAQIAVGIEPANAEARYALGDALSHQPGATRVALAELARAFDLTADPELRATILSRQGEVLVEQGEYRAALELFARAMDLAPRDARPRVDYARAVLRFEPDARARAIDLLHQALAVAPWYSLAYSTLAEIAETQNDLAGAEEWYRKGLAHASRRNNADLLFGLAQFYARQNRVDDARATMILAMRYETRGDVLLIIARALEGLNAR